jgi:hypothetical protein
MKAVEQGITEAVGAVGNAASADLRHLNLASVLGDEEVGVPSGMLVPRGSNGPDAFVLGWPTVIEVKRSSTKSKVRGSHVVHVERIWKQSLRAGDPDGKIWFQQVTDWLKCLPTGLQGWHDATTRCWDDESAACYGWSHSLPRRGRTCVACPQPAPYLFCDYAPEGVTITPESRLVVLGGVGEGVQDFYGGIPEEYGPNLERFVLTTHERYLNRLAAGLAELKLEPEDCSRVANLVSLMWSDMTCAEAAQLDVAVDGLILPRALEAFPCACELCARWRR